MSVHAHVTVGSYGHILYGYDVEIGGSEAVSTVCDWHWCVYVPYDGDGSCLSMHL